VRPCDQKATLTKAIYRYLRTRFSVSKIQGSLTTGSHVFQYEVTLTPGSDMLVSSFKTADSSMGGHSDRLSVPRLSDFIVRNNGYEQFMSGISQL